MGMACAASARCLESTESTSALKFRPHTRSKIAGILLNASEAARRHCLIMENCCYDDSETTVLNMVRAGLLGDLVHGECAYNHDLREILFENKDEGLWRRRHHTLRDSNLYPTHGLGPMAQYMDINRGDRFDHIVSMSSTHLGLEAYRKEHVPAGRSEVERGLQDRRLQHQHHQNGAKDGRSCCSIMSARRVRTIAST